MDKPDVEHVQRLISNRFNEERNDFEQSVNDLKASFRKEMDGVRQRLQALEGLVASLDKPKEKDTENPTVNETPDPGSKTTVKRTRKKPTKKKEVDETD